MQFLCTACFFPEQCLGDSFQEESVPEVRGTGCQGDRQLTQVRGTGCQGDGQLTQVRGTGCQGDKQLTQIRGTDYYGDSNFKAVETTSRQTLFRASHLSDRFY